jgi:Xaa-Pro aminopeptidase
MVPTIEPGLYFQPDDLTVLEEFRGIGCGLIIILVNSRAEKL